MTVRVDPENNETRVLFDLADFSEQSVLEIGCGDGRLTWRYADRAKHVIAIDPFGESIARASENLPERLRARTIFQHLAFEEFAAQSKTSVFDRVILSWSL